MSRWAERMCQVRVLEERLGVDSANLSLAEELWGLVGSGDLDMRSGVRLVRIFRGPAIAGEEGVLSLAREFRVLADLTGDLPRRELFDDDLWRAVSGVADQIEDKDLNWMLRIIGQKHRAFPFFFDDFEIELRPLLEASLIENDPASIIAFIREEAAVLRNPHEGKALRPDWEDTIEVKDVHQYGDIALTKYYDPACDIGLGILWREAEKTLRRLRVPARVILGVPCGPEFNLFDPGKMGSFFQSVVDVQENLRIISGILELQEVEIMLRSAATKGCGLYVTF